MPNYEFTDGTNVHTVFFHMDEEKIYNGTNGDEHGKWKRVWNKPQMSIDTQYDCYSSKDFVKATNKKGILGDLWERSGEFGEKRKEKDGKDMIKEKFYENYSKKRHGKQHPEQKREKIKEKYEKMGIDVDFGA